MPPLTAVKIVRATQTTARRSCSKARRKLHTENQRRLNLAAYQTDYGFLPSRLSNLSNFTLALEFKVNGEHEKPVRELQDNGSTQ